MDFSNFLQSISAYILPVGLMFALLVSFLIVYFASHRPAKSVPVANICQKRRLNFKIFIILPLLCVAVLPSVCLSSAYAGSEHSVVFDTFDDSNMETNRGFKAYKRTRVLTISSFISAGGESSIRFKSTYTFVDKNDEPSIYLYYDKDGFVENYYGNIHFNLEQNSSMIGLDYEIKKHNANSDSDSDLEKSTYYYIEVEGKYLASGDKTTYIIKDFSTDWYLSWAGQAKQWLESNRLPLIITLLVAGGFLAVFLGINLAKAEDAAAATKAKQRMLYLVIGVFVTIILLFFLDWLLGNIDTIQTSIQQHVTDSNSVKFLEKLK